MLTTIPVDLLLKIITFVPFKDVYNIAFANKRLFYIHRINKTYIHKCILRTLGFFIFPKPHITENILWGMHIIDRENNDRPFNNHIYTIINYYNGHYDCTNNKFYDPFNIFELFTLNKKFLKYDGVKLIEEETNIDYYYYYKNERRCWHSIHDYLKIACYLNHSDMINYLINHWVSYLTGPEILLITFDNIDDFNYFKDFINIKKNTLTWFGHKLSNHTTITQVVKAFSFSKPMTIEILSSLIEIYAKDYQKLNFIRSLWVDSGFNYFIK